MGTQTELTALISPLINVYKTVNNEWKHFFEIGLEEYLRSQTEKYYLTNTFIHRSEKVKFKDIYYPLKATYKELTTDFWDIDELLKNYSKITLIGTAGSGKTTLLKYLFFQCIQLTDRIPIVIELRNLNTYEGDFENMILEKVLNLKISPADNIYRRILHKGNFVFLLDGYDEIFSTRKQEINSQIEKFIDSYPENAFVISTRPGGGIEGFIRFYDFAVDELSNDEIGHFVNKIVKETERKIRIKETIDNPNSRDYHDYLRNPLLLSMFILAFESHPEIPSKKSGFYWNVFHTLYSRHDGVTKNSFLREKLTKLQRDEFELILNTFSYLSLLDKKYSFTEKYTIETLIKVRQYTKLDFKIEDLVYDLRTAISILTLDGFEYSFPHRSLQEYFTAQFISKLPNNKKGKAYTKVFDTFDYDSNDFSYNLWTLFLEIDRNAFLESLILPKLKEYSELLNVDSDFDLFERYADLSEGELGTDSSETIRYLIFPNTFHQIIDFLKIYDYLELADFHYNFSEKTEILKLLGTESNPNLIRLDNPLKKREVFNILLKTNFMKVVKKFRASISNRILHYESEILRQSNSIDDLLDM